MHMLRSARGRAGHLVRRGLDRVVTGVAARAAIARGERGDVPGWVLITLMTAGLVTVLWAVAGARLEALFTQALDSVTGPGQ
jgi:hypothetical protein